MGKYSKVAKSKFEMVVQNCNYIFQIQYVIAFKLPARPIMDQTLKKQMTHTMMLAGDFRTASRKFP